MENSRNAVVSQLEPGRAYKDTEDLQQVVPICAWRRKVKPEEESNSWFALEDYRMGSEVITHGICPDCKGSAF